MSYSSFNLDVATFDDLITAIESQKYYAGLMTSDVAAFYQDILSERDLRIVRHYPNKVIISELLMTTARPKLTEAIKSCFSIDGAKKYIMEDIFAKYNKYIKVRLSLSCAVS